MLYQAVIFDLDGTVLDNEDIYDAAFCSVLEKHGVSRKDLKGHHTHTAGIGLEANWRKLKKQYGVSDISVTTLVHETQDAYHAKISRDLIRPGFFQLYKALREEKIMTALTTSNDWWLVEDELQDLGLDVLFDTTVTAEEVVNNKPAPDLFLVTSRKLQVEPEDCIVIEDSEAGVQAGKAAGMLTIRIGKTSISKEKKELADVFVTSFETLNPERLNRYMALKKGKT